MESGNSSPTPGQSGQEDRDEDEGLEDDSDVRVQQSHRPVDESNSEAVSCSREEDFEDENRPGPSSRIRLLEAEPGTSNNGLILSRPIADSDSDSADDEADFDRYAMVTENADSDSREAWAPSSSEVIDRSSNFDHFSPRPSNWNGPTPQSTSWSISSTSAPSSVFSVASSAASSILSSSFAARPRSPVASTSAGDVSNPASPLGEQPGPSGYQSGTATPREQEPGPSGYSSGRATSNDHEPVPSGYMSARGPNSHQYPGPSGYPSGASRDHEPGPSGYSSSREASHNPEPHRYLSDMESSSSGNPGSSGNRDQLPVPSDYPVRASSANEPLYLPGDPEPGPSGYSSVDEASHDQEPRYDSVGDSTHDLEPGPSDYQSIFHRGVREPVNHSVGSASNDPEPGPSGYQSGGRAYHDLRYHLVGDSEHDLEPGPSGYQANAGSYPDSEPGPSGYHSGASRDQEPGPSGYSSSRSSTHGQEAGASRYQSVAGVSNNDQEPGPSDYPGLVIDHDQADNGLSGLIHGEISNPPSPLGGQVDESDIRNPDSPQAGPSDYFGAPFLPDPVSNPSSPQAGPSTSPSKRRNNQPDSYNNKRGRFEPTPGPSNSFIHRQRNNLNVSSSEAVAISAEPMSPFQPNSPAMPHTPADNYQISSSTGFNDSVPATPCDHHNQVETNDLSVPSPLVTPRRINLDVDDGVDSTVDSSGYSLANHHHLRQEEEEEEEEAMVSHRETMNEAESGCVQSSQYNDSSAESEDDEAMVQSVNNVMNCASQGNSNDAISTSGQIDEPSFVDRRDLFIVTDEPVAGPSTSNPEVYNNGVSSRHFADESLDMIPIQNHPESEDNDVEYVEPEFESPPVPVFATNQAARLYEPSSSYNNRVGSNQSNSVSESPRLYGLISERPSTSKGYSRERDRLHTEQNNRFNNRHQQQECDSNKPAMTSSEGHSEYAPNHYGAQQSFASTSRHNDSANFGSLDHVGRGLDGYMDDSNSPESGRAESGGFVVESEPSKFKSASSSSTSYHHRDVVRGANHVADVDLVKRSNNEEHFDDPFLPDFDPSNEEGNLPASFPHIDAGPSFGQPVDLEDIQVQNLGAESYCSPVVTGRSSMASGVDISSPNQSRSSFSAAVSSSGEETPSFSIGLAFTGMPPSLATSASATTTAESAPSTSGMTGPLSKRLRTLHSLQQQKQHKDDEPDENNFPFPSSSQRPPNNNSNNHNSDDSDGDQNSFLGGTQQTFSVTIETIGTGNAIKPKKFFQQKSAVDSSLLDQPHLGEDKNFGGQNNFNSFAAFVDPISPIVSEKHLQSIALSKGKRLKKSRIVWCKDCQVHYNQDCLVHRKVSMQISDQPVVSRARASLPSSYLIIKKVDRSDFGVFAKKLIPKACRFGPLEGRPAAPFEMSGDGVQKFQLLVRADDGTISRIDVSDEDNSNWMRFVRPATSFAEQNTIITQENGHLYYTTTRNVSCKNELRIWYSKEYAQLFAQSHQLGLFVGPNDNEIEDMSEVSHPWPCFECSKRFESSQILQQHLNEHDDGQESATIPAKPKKSSKSKMLLYRHNHHLSNLGSKSFEKKSKKFRCHICPRHYDRQFSLQRHLALHKGDKSYKCDECHAKFSLPFNLSRHRKKVHFVDPSGAHTRCPTCGLWFKLGSVFKLHVLSHQPKWKVHNLTVEDALAHAGRNITPSEDENEMQFECPQCDRQFETWFDLVAHCTEHGSSRLPSHGPPASMDGMRPQTMSPEKKRGKLLHKCELCYKAFASEDRLTRHMAVHGSDDAKPLSCSHCGKRFLSNSALACHLKVHSDDTNVYDCPICSATFDQIHALKEHVHVHRHNDSYTCPHCSKSFGEYAQIRKHIRAFHAEKKFQCPECDKSFTGADKLKAHMVKHSDRREFLCTDCGKQFKRKDKLKEHIKRMHTGDKKLKVANAKRDKAAAASVAQQPKSAAKFVPKAVPTDYNRFIYKCHDCLLGFKRRGMLVNHLAKRHPDVSPQNVPELNLPILKATKDYFCQYCHKVYKSSSKRKVHILKNHPGAKLPPSVRDKVALAEEREPNPTFSTTVGSVTSQPHSCQHCHKQYASNAKLLQHLRKKHEDDSARNAPRQNGEGSSKSNEKQLKFELDPILDNEGGDVAYVTVDASSLEGGGEHSGPLIHLQNIYPSTSNGHARSSRNLVFHTENGASLMGSGSSSNGGASLDLSEIRLGEATLVPVQSNGGELSHGLECRTADGEILQLQLTRVPQSEALRLASSGATVIHVPAEQQQQQQHLHHHQQHQQQLHACVNIEQQGYRTGLGQRPNSNSGLVLFNALVPDSDNFFGQPQPHHEQHFVSDFDDDVQQHAQQVPAQNQQQQQQIHSLQNGRFQQQQQQQQQQQHRDNDTSDIKGYVPDRR